MNIKSMPLDDRPREKMLQKGVDALSNAELLAVLLRTGGKGKSAIEIAQELIDKPEKLLALRALKPKELAMQKGIGPAKAVTVVAALELGRRLAALNTTERESVTSTKEAVALLMPRLRHETKEQLFLLLLNARAQVLSVEKVGQGSLTSLVVLPSEIFQVAIMNKAAAIILAHNHPSGEPRPSTEDVSFTDKLVQAGRIMGIPILDHIIIGDGRYISFSEEGYI